MNFVNIFKLVLLNSFFLILGAKYNAQALAGNMLYGAPVIHDVYLNFSQPGYLDSLTNNYVSDVYMKCSMILDGVTYTTVGVKFKGNSSYNNPGKKKSLKIGIDEFVANQKYDGIKKFNLNNGFKDPTMMREKLALDFANKMGVYAPRCAYARVYLNNVYWGLYTLVEEIDKTFLEGRFNDKKGNLFKGDPQGDLKWYGSSASFYYPKYELKTNTTANNWSDLVHAIDKINNTPANFYDSLETVMNTASVIKCWALCNIFSNLDSYLGSGHNYFIYNDSLSLKFNYIAWDVNESFGNFTMGMSVSQMESLSMFFISNPQANRPLYQKMLANATYKSRLVTEICNMLNYFNASNLNPKIDSIKLAINNDVIADTNKFFSYNDFLNNINSDIVSVSNPGNSTIAGLKPFIQKRNTFLTGELAANGCYVGLEDFQDAAIHKIYPNPTGKDGVTIKSSELIKSVELYNLLGNKIMDLAPSKNEFYLSLTNFSSGIYFVKINGSSFKKLVIEGDK
ncbi:MAG: CotH kinase family protein [Bacteroidia bacterium]